MKRILLVTQYFYPELFRSNDIAFELARRGYKVDVLASIPNYPKGKYFDGYGVFRKRKEVVNKVRIYRVFQTPRGKVHSGVKLALNYLTYAFFGSLWALCFAIFKRKYDAIVVHQTSPITQAIPAIIISRLTKTPVYTWVLDIWPDAMRSGGGIKNEKIIGVIDNLTQWVYRKSCKILISSKDFRELVNRKADYNDKIVYFPNWCDDMQAMSLCEIPQLPQGFRIMMAGNIGTAQDIKTVMKAVLLLKDNQNIQWIFVGDGSEKVYIEEYVLSNNITNVTLTGKRPFSEMPSYFKEADVMLLTLRAEFPHLKAVVPARLQSYMSAGKPIVGMVNGGSVAVINESECGLCARAGDYQSLARNIEALSHDRERIIEMGENARKFYESNFTTEQCISNLEKIISIK